MATPTRLLLPRQSTGNDQADQLLDLLSKGFRPATGTALIAAVASSLGFALALVGVFCVLRPLNNIVYAPRAKYADAKHVPPPIDRSIFAWVKPVIRVKEDELAEKLGLDATVFLRVARMSRNMFAVLSVVGCAILIPVNLIGGRGIVAAFSGEINTLQRLTSEYLISTPLMWAYVVTAYLFDVVICFFLWQNYRAVTRLRRTYFDSADYQQSLAARTLLVTDIPAKYRSDEGIQTIAEQTYRTNDVPRAAIARNTKGLPDLVEEHTEAVHELEAVLAKYLKNPNKLPAQRPTCKAERADSDYKAGEKVDAIECLSKRIKRLEHRIREVRGSVDSRNPQNYGFASYQQISDAHLVAYAGRKKAPHHTKIRLAPKPHDLIWKNLHMTPKDRAWANFINNLWVALLTLFWTVPSLLIAVFLTDLSRLAEVWPAFRTNYYANLTAWGIFQGIVPPAVTAAFFYFLPIIFRRLSTRSGDVTKTSRERHVVHKLFAFFVVNNLVIFSLFTAIWAYIAALVALTKTQGDVWETFKNDNLGVFQGVVTSLNGMSTYWLTFLLQRNLGAAIDLAQLVNLAWGSFSRRYLSPTPRQVIQLSAPQPFDYASYYNYFLFYSIVALSFAAIQPLTLPVAAFYFAFDAYMKKYLLMYVFITKTESGGRFWRVIFNRFLFSALFGNVIMALFVIKSRSTWAQPIAMAPLPFILLAFKWYCKRSFDDRILFYATVTEVERNLPVREGKARGTDKVGVRFGNPVLYKKLITPMVHAKSKHLLKNIYSGRTDIDNDDTHTVSGYSDMYMNPMSSTQPGRPQSPMSVAPFEIVSEHELDFEHFKDRAEFRSEAGGDGELFGRPADMLRKDSSLSGMTDFTSQSGRETPAGYRSGSRSESVSSERTKIDPGATTYPHGYHVPTGSAMRDTSADSWRSDDMGNRRPVARQGSREDIRQDLMSGAARMGRSPSPMAHGQQQQQQGQYRSASRGPTTARHHAWTPDTGMTPGMEAGMPADDGTSYDYFRGRRG